MHLFESLKTADGKHKLALIRLFLKVTKFIANVKASSISSMLQQRVLEDLARSPLDYIERACRDEGITCDADSFFFVSKLSARNSPGLPPIPSQPAWGGAEGSLPPRHPNLATNLTDGQWTLLAPLIPPDPHQDWLTGSPPVLIAANRFDFTRHTPASEFADFLVMQRYHEVIKKFPALLASSRLPAKRRGRPRRSTSSPRALLDAIFWKLATGQKWKALPSGFPPMRACRKYYRRLYSSGRLYTLLFALYDHLRLEAGVDPHTLLEQGVFTTTPCGHIALSPGAPQTWKNYTALLFMQLAREAYARFERYRKQEDHLYTLIPVFKGSDPLSTAKLPCTPYVEPLETSSAARKYRKSERDSKTIARAVSKRAATKKADSKAGDGG